jgi:hypothetical protein
MERVKIGPKAFVGTSEGSLGFGGGGNAILSLLIRWKEDLLFFAKKGKKIPSFHLLVIFSSTPVGIPLLCRPSNQNSQPTKIE